MSSTRKVLVLVVILSTVGGLGFFYARRSAPAKLAPATVKETPATERKSESIQGRALPDLKAGKKFVSSSKSIFEQGHWARESELKAKGLSTPVAAYESLMHAATGGDVKGTASAIFLTEEARRRADKLLASIPAEKRAEYSTAEELVSSLYIGASGVTGVRSGEVSYQFLTEQSGIGITPLALGLEESMASSSAYQTIKSKARSPTGKESEPIAVFYKTNDGWKWVIPPSMIDAFGRLLKNGPAQPSSKK